MFAALEVTSGKVHGRCYRRHRHQEFIEFLNSLARRYPGRELHQESLDHFNRNGLITCRMISNL